MKVYSIILIALAVVLAVSIVCVWLVSSIQDFMAGNVMWNGVKNIMDTPGAVEAESLAELPSEPRDTVMISIPYLDYSVDELESLRNYVAKGGTLLLMDDYGFGNRILEFLNVSARFDGRALLDPLFCYKNPWMPKVTDFSSGTPEDIEVVVLNHATAIKNIDHSQTLAWSSTASYLDTNENEDWDQGEPKGPFAVAVRMEYGEGTLVLASDPSLVINTMLNRDDNLDFVGYLMAPERSSEEVLFDISHLSRTPLDVAKPRVNRARQMLAEPYPLVAVLFGIFVGTTVWMARNGGKVGKQTDSS
jgi:hypothetical protein